MLTNTLLLYVTQEALAKARAVAQAHLAARKTTKQAPAVATPHPNRKDRNRILPTRH